MDCISVTPRLHRDELDKCVNRPVCLLLQYESHKPGDAFISGKLLQALLRICSTLDLTVNQDSKENLDSLGSSSSSNEHLQRFLTKAAYLQETLGAWSAEYFIIETFKLLRHSVLARTDRILDAATDVKRSIFKYLEHLQLDGLTHDGFDTNGPSFIFKSTMPCGLSCGAATGANYRHCVCAKESNGGCSMSALVQASYDERKVSLCSIRWLVQKLVRHKSSR